MKKKVAAKKITKKVVKTAKKPAVGKAAKVVKKPVKKAIPKKAPLAKKSAKKTAKPAVKKGAPAKTAKPAVKKPAPEIVKPTINPASLIKVKELCKLFVNRKHTAEPIFVKPINTKLPTIKDRYGYAIAHGKDLKPENVIVTSAYDYGLYAIINYTTSKGSQKSDYFSLDFEFSRLLKEDAEYTEMVAAAEAVKLKLLHLELGHNFMIGSDPEIFVEEAGRLIPAFLFLPSKDKPAYTADTAGFNGHGGMPMYWDGFQAEFTTQAQHCLGYHGDSIAAGMKGVYKAAKKRFPNSQLSIRSVFHIEPEILSAAAEEHVAFGCMPSINAYGLKVKMPPARQVPFRSAGGHIHFGIGKGQQKDADKIVRALDAILGVACVSLFAEFDDPARRKLYGLPGEYRLPPHGLEYRPLSNAWLSHPMIMNLVIDLSRKCVVFGQKDFMPYWNATEEETLDCIIRCDVEAAQKILLRNKEVFKQLLKASYFEDDDDYDYDDPGKTPKKKKSEMDILFDVFMNGIGSAVNDPTDLTANWCLESGWKRHAGGHREPNVRSFLDSRRRDSKYKF